MVNSFRELKNGLTPLTLPMGLTLGRLAMVPVFLGLVATHHRYTAFALFAVMTVSDNLDGRLARRWGQTTRLGLLLDPVADKVLVSCSLVLLAFERFAPDRIVIPWAVPLGVFLKDLGVVIGIAVVARRNGRVALRPVPAGKVSTSFDLALVLATLLGPAWVAISPAFAGTFLWALWWATVWAAAAAGMAYSVEGARQLRTAPVGRVESAP